MWMEICEDGILTWDVSEGRLIKKLSMIVLVKYKVKEGNCERGVQLQ